MCDPLPHRVPNLMEEISSCNVYVKIMLKIYKDDKLIFPKLFHRFYFTLFGREQAPPRWKNCISQVNSNMGMALGSMFVRKYFDETSKNDTLTMTREIQQSFRELLRITDWIDDKTKKLAAHKVDAMMLRIGYPDFILSKKELDERYKEVKIHPDKYFENILNILHHLTKMEQSRLVWTGQICLKGPHFFCELCMLLGENCSVCRSHI